MNVTSAIPNGSGRVRHVSPERIEIELIAYSKGARYFCVEISEVEEPCEQEILLLPDSLFRVPTFIHKFHADVWICDAEERDWQRVKKIERTPEMVRCEMRLLPGKRYLVSSEPPYRYVDTTREMHQIAASHPDIASIHYLGHSMEHRPITALRISSEPVPPGRENKPVIHIVAGEHASESAGEEIARGMLDLALSEPAFRRDFIFDFVLNSNPDGNYHGWHQYNLRDWREHNYQDTVDRSWHHEFVPYMQGLPLDFSPETIALMEWMKTTRPACYLSMHSWEGHDGMPGAFHAHPKELTPRMAEAVTAISEIACAESERLGFTFFPFASESDGLHLGQFLMRNEAAAAFLPEGNYAIGRKALQSLGTGLLRGILCDPRIPLRDLGGDRWQKIEDVLTNFPAAPEFETAIH